MLGTLRINMAGTRIVSTTDFSTWIQYCRANPLPDKVSDKGKGKGKGKPDVPAVQQGAVMSLGQVNSTVTYKEMKERFRNCTQALLKNI